MQNHLYFDDKFVFDKTTLKDIVTDIYNNPCTVTQLGKKDISHIVDLTDNEIKLKENIAIIYYYGELRLIGLNLKTKQFEIFNLPTQFENILRNIDCFSFNESTIITLLDSQYDEIDFYFIFN